MNNLFMLWFFLPKFIRNYLRKKYCSYDGHRVVTIGPAPGWYNECSMCGDDDIKDFDKFHNMGKNTIGGAL